MGRDIRQDWVVGLKGEGGLLRVKGQIGMSQQF